MSAGQFGVSLKKDKTCIYSLWLVVVYFFLSLLLLALAYSHYAIVRLSWGIHQHLIFIPCLIFSLVFLPYYTVFAVICITIKECYTVRGTLRECVEHTSWENLEEIKESSTYNDTQETNQKLKLYYDMNTNCYYYRTKLVTFVCVLVCTVQLQQCSLIQL